MKVEGCEASYMIMNPNTNITIKHNKALFTGGGIFAESRCVQIQPLCFYQINSTNQNLTEIVKNNEVNISIFLTNNSANYAGSQLFGGTVDNCHIPGVDEDIFYDLFYVPSKDTDSSSISLDPLNVCFCKAGKPFYDGNNTMYKDLYVGQEFNISIVTVGQYNGTVPGEVEYVCDAENVKIDNKPQQLPKKCTDVSLSVHSPKSGEVNIIVKVKNQHANYQLNSNALLIRVHLKDKPLGFTVSDKNCSYTCVDKPSLVGEGFKCLLNDSQAFINRPSPKWLGYYNESRDLYKRCPINYCYGYDVNITTNHTVFSQDEQCANNRAGVLCGHCRTGFSLTLGSTALIIQF